jgi:PKD repeat protein
LQCLYFLGASHICVKKLLRGSIVMNTSRPFTFIRLIKKQSRIAASLLFLGSCVIFGFSPLLEAAEDIPQNGDEWGNWVEPVQGHFMAQPKSSQSGCKYIGTASGTFSGGDAGSWKASFNSGCKAKGSGYSMQDGYFSATGNVSPNGKIHMVAGSVSTGAVFSGTINDSGEISGTWRNSYWNLKGTFSGIYMPSASLPVVSFSYFPEHDDTALAETVYGVSTQDIDKHILAGGNIIFDASSSMDVDDIVKYVWKLNGRKVLDAEEPTFKWLPSLPGSYKVSLTVQNSSGFSSTTSKSIDILGLEVGDLLFIRTAWWDLPFNIINNIYTHVGMYIGSGKMIESSLTEVHGGDAGVHISKLAEWSNPTETFVTAYRVKAASHTEKSKAVKFALSKLGYGYDVFPAQKQEEGPAYYCSELIWAAYYSATSGRINLGNSSPLFGVLPDDIAQDSDNLKFLGGHWESYPK